MVFVGIILDGMFVLIVFMSCVLKVFQRESIDSVSDRLIMVSEISMHLSLSSFQFALVNAYTLRFLVFVIIGRIRESTKIA